ncbi:MAG: hypothetical protein HC812_08125 [Leptolyngbya sp. RL_3_1]|nr:hypothetical protein [Leptolyngbya sp. RL_3_1]
MRCQSPDVAWVAQSRWEALTPEQRRKFPPICPDFALELVSPSDRVWLLKILWEKIPEILIPSF